jgi:hypothetical protein
VKPDEYLDETAREFWRCVDNIRSLEGVRAETRKEFFRMAEEVWGGRDHLLPVRTVEIPETFFKTTGMSQAEFVETRFPGWDVEHVELNTVSRNRIFVLKRNPKYLGRVVEVNAGGDLVQVAKDVSEFTPEIDWTTLKQERPDLYERLARHVIHTEVNEEELEKMYQETPEDIATLERHLRVREPVLRATAKRVKPDGKRRSTGVPDA